MFGLGIAIFALAFLPVALFVREPATPKAALSPRSGEVATLTGIGFAEAIRTWRYWAMTLTFFFAATAINGSLIHVVPLLTDRGISAGVAIGALSAAGLALIVGRVDRRLLHRQDLRALYRGLLPARADGGHCHSCDRDGHPLSEPCCSDLESARRSI